MSEYKQIQYPLSVKWDATVKTGDFTAETTLGYFVDTTRGQVTVTLPASPSIGDQVAFKDYAGTFGTNKLLIARNGSKIQGNDSDSQLTTNRGAGILVYVDSTQGWIYQQQSNASDNEGATFIQATGGTITTCGNYKIHTFTSSGTFTVSALGNPVGGPNTVDYMVVAGGGGSAGGNQGMGGSGAGGFRESVPSPAAWTASPLANPGGSLPVSVQGYPVTVGGGGAGSPVEGVTGPSGSPSVFSTITSAGGGGGGAGGGPADSTPGGNGGSAGGGGGRSNKSGGSGNTPPVSPPQGNNGGNSKPAATPTADFGGGGGGATVAGSNASNSASGAGGNGATTSFSGSPLSFAGGGAGQAEPGTPQPGGTGGGGPSGASGTANTGGGAGGSNTSSGGSGIVKIRYRFQ